MCGAPARAPAGGLGGGEREPGRRGCGVGPAAQLSLAIGKEGQNARLAARLTGLKIDIRPASDPEPAEELMEESAEEPVEVVEDQPEQAEELMGEEE